MTLVSWALADEGCFPPTYPDRNISREGWGMVLGYSGFGWESPVQGFSLDNRSGCQGKDCVLTTFPNPFAIPGIRGPGPRAQPTAPDGGIQGRPFCLWACSLCVGTWMLCQNSLPFDEKLLGWGHTGTMCEHTCHRMDGEPGLTWPLWVSEEEPSPWGYR